jgi:hypothetical protein
MGPHSRKRAVAIQNRFHDPEPDAPALPTRLLLGIDQTRRTND